VTRPDVHLVDRPLAREVEADRLHEAQRALDLVRERLVALAGRVTTRRTRGSSCARE
jgi:hypothetical protein